MTLKLPTIKGFSVPKFVRLRGCTLLQRWLGALGVTASPLRVIFVHVPKMAGTSAKDYLIACLGSRRSGHTVNFTDMFLGEDVSASDIEAAGSARFVCGHFSWAVKEKIGGGPAVVFTTVGAPAERLWSLYFTMRATRPKLIRPEMADIYKWAKELSPEAFYALDDDRIRYFTDNAIVRQFAGSFDWRPETDAEWRKLLDAAKRNLRAFDFVCFKDSFDRDFVRVLKAASLPVALPIGQKNVTSDAAFTDSDKRKAKTAFVENAENTIGPLVRWDQQFYDYALELRAKGEI